MTQILSTDPRLTERCRGLVNGIDSIAKSLFGTMDVLRPNPEGFVCINWKERKGGDMEGRIQ